MRTQTGNGIEVIFFDLGGVIVHVDYGGLLHKLHALTRLPEDEIQMAVVDSELTFRFDRGEISPQQFYQILSGQLRLPVSFVEFSEIWTNMFRLNREVAELIPKLSERYRLLLISNTDPLHFGHVQQRFPVLSLLEGFILSYQTGRLKPEPEIYLEALRTAKVSSDACLFIDDIEANIRGAQALGIAGIVYNSKTDLKSELASHGVRV